MGKYDNMVKADLIQACKDKDKQISALQTRLKELSNAKQEAEQANLMVSALFDESVIKQRLGDMIAAKQKEINEITQRIAELQTAPLRDSERTRLITAYNSQKAEVETFIADISASLEKYENIGGK